MEKQEVTILGYDLMDFYEQLDENDKRLFFILLAVGKTGEFARDYISCKRDNKMF